MQNLGVEIMREYLNSENIYISQKDAEILISKWEKYYPNLDVLSLVALAISDSSENYHLTPLEISKIRSFYFYN